MRNRRRRTLTVLYLYLATAYGFVPSSGSPLYVPKSSSPLRVLVPEIAEPIKNTNVSNLDGVQLPIPPNATEKTVPLPNNLPARYRHGNKLPVLQRGSRSAGRQDSLAALAEDLTIVLHEFRNETYDPEVPLLLRHYSSPTNRLSTSAALLTTPLSRFTLRILPAWGVATSWSIWVVRKLDTVKRFKPWNDLSWSVISLSFCLVSVCCMALANEGWQRIARSQQQQARMEQAVEELAQVLATTVYPKDPRLGLKMARHASLYGWFWMLSLRGRQSKDGMDEYVIRFMLRQADADFLLGHCHANTAILTRIRQAMTHMSIKDPVSGSKSKWTMMEALVLDRALTSLSKCSGSASSLRRSVLPNVAMSHVARLVQLFLLVLPFTLYGRLPSHIWTIGLSSAASYWLLGLQEMASVWQRPWDCLDLHATAKSAMKRVADVFLLPPPAINYDNDGHYVMREPPYW